MGSRPEESLSRRERQIMDVVYARGEATAADVAAGLPNPPTRTAVRTLLRILEQKGHLKATQQDRAYLYRPARPKQQVIKEMVRDFVNRVFNGSGQPLVLHLLAPSNRPVQVTSDLAGFWERHWPAIRKELMRRYPRHRWPEDPRG